MKVYIIISTTLLCFGCSFGQIVNKGIIVERINSQYTKWLSHWQKGQLKETDLSDDGVYKIDAALSIQQPERRFQTCAPSKNHCIDIYTGSYEFVEGSDSIVSNGVPESLIILSGNNT